MGSSMSSCKGLSYRGYDQGLSRSSGFKNYKANPVQNSLNVIDTIYLHCQYSEYYGM